MVQSSETVGRIYYLVNGIAVLVCVIELIGLAGNREAFPQRIFGILTDEEPNEVHTAQDSRTMHSCPA